MAKSSITPANGSTVSLWGIIASACVCVWPRWVHCPVAITSPLVNAVKVQSLWRSTGSELQAGSAVESLLRRYGDIGLTEATPDYPTCSLSGSFRNTPLLYFLCFLLRRTKHPLVRSVWIYSLQMVKSLDVFDVKSLQLYHVDPAQCCDSDCLSSFCSAASNWKNLPNSEPRRWDTTHAGRGIEVDAG